MSRPTKVPLGGDENKAIQRSQMEAEALISSNLPLEVKEKSRELLRALKQESDVHGENIGLMGRKEILDKKRVAMNSISQRSITPDETKLFAEKAARQGSASFTRKGISPVLAQNQMKFLEEKQKKEETAIKEMKQKDKERIASQSPHQFPRDEDLPKTQGPAKVLARFKLSTVTKQSRNEFKENSFIDLEGTFKSEKKPSSFKTPTKSPVPHSSNSGMPLVAKPKKLLAVVSRCK